MTSIFLQLRKSQNVLNFCSHLLENQLRYISPYIYIYKITGNTRVIPSPLIRHIEFARSVEG